ncbi:molecular chaperone [Enterobacter cloacae]|uniref:fimbrial biogenesis chaperone n=1 Tax=Enterobacter cloacae TaxID=550 RepID=UPI002FF6BA38
MVKLYLIQSIRILILTGMITFNANASIQISSTRIIYHADEKDVSAEINNPGKYPVLLQSWIDSGNPDIKPENIATPFVLTPPLVRVNAGEGQTLRLVLVDHSISQEMESVYWLNVLEIPPVVDKKRNQIQVAFRSRIKIFYRPSALDDKGARLAGSQLIWRQQGKQILITNPTPYFVSLVAITFSSGSKKVTVPADMVAPKTTKSFSLPDAPAISTKSKVTVDYINDYGAVTTESIKQ